jgi:hypothetical protein
VSAGKLGLFLGAANGRPFVFPPLVIVPTGLIATN